MIIKKQFNFFAFVLTATFLQLVITTPIFATEAQYNGTFSGTKKLSRNIQNECVVFGTPPPIRVHNGTVTSASLFQNVSGNVIGNTIIFINRLGTNHIKYVGQFSQEFGHYQIKGTFSRTDAPPCTGTFEMTGGEVSSAEPGTGGSKLLQWLKSFNPVQELLRRRASIHEIIDGVSIAEQTSPKSSQTELGAELLLTPESKLINLPLSYTDADLTLSADLPLIWSDDQLKPGNISGNAQLASRNFGEQILINALSFDLPTGDSDFVSKGINLKLGQSWIRSMGATQLFLNYAYQYTGKDKKLNPGDSVNITFGLNRNWNQQLPWIGTSNSIYGMLSHYEVYESQYDGFGYGDQQTLIDFSVGILDRPKTINLGLSIPVFTRANYFSNSDRLISLDLGYRFGRY